MYFLWIGVSGLALKYLQIKPVAGLSWWLVLLPFVLAIGWWTWADASGYTMRKEIKKLDDRKQKRLDRQRATMGSTSKKRS